MDAYLIITTTIILILALVIVALQFLNKNNSDDDLDIITPKILDQERVIGGLEETLNELRNKSAALNAQKVSLVDKISQRDGTIDTLSKEIRDQQIALSQRLSNVTGRLNFGEIELERSLELSGLSNNISYFLQEPIKDGDGEIVLNANGSRMIPDATIILPDGRNLYIDAKYPITALDTLRENSEDPSASQIFATTFQNRINEVSNSGYHESGLNTPGFTVMFVPGDHFIMEAIKGNPHIIEHALQRNVVVATPGTLFTIIRTVELSFSREQFSQKVKDFEKQARDLTEKAEKFLKDLQTVGQRSEQLQKAYKNAINKLSGQRGLLKGLKSISTRDLTDISEED